MASFFRILAARKLEREHKHRRSRGWWGEPGVPSPAPLPPALLMFLRLPQFSRGQDAEKALRTRTLATQAKTDYERPTWKTSGKVFIGTILDLSSWAVSLLLWKSGYGILNLSFSLICRPTTTELASHLFFKQVQNSELWSFHLDEKKLIYTPLTVVI